MDALLPASRYWGLEQSELVQGFLMGQPSQIAQRAEDKLLDGIVDALPADAVTRSMQRLALFTHLPPIRKGLSQPPRAFERIKQFPNPPPRSARYQPPVAGGVFGPPPEAHKAVLTATQTRAPQAPLPTLSPRSQPRALERRIASSRGATAVGQSPRGQ